MPKEQIANAYLVIQKDSFVGKRIELWKACTTIGRSRDSDIFLEDVAVHRKQASILYDDGQYTLRDDHGSGDSFVNGEAIVEQVLNHGDQLLFGGTGITFYISEGTQPFQLPSSRGRELHMGKTADAQAATPARLQLTQASNGIRDVELLSNMTIGRSRTCNIFLEDLTVSRLHATIKETEQGGYEIVDHHSATGTFVNGKAITHAMLNEGDSIQIGNTHFTFRRPQA
jgi:pSer/pThr/pTyr-binding forkhead associated (FHA) protein